MTRVLLAEDDAAISDPLARALVREGYEVTVHEDGREALDSALGTPPDLLVLDLGLPTLDGLEVCRRLRATGSDLSLIHISEPTRRHHVSRMPSSA